MKYRTIKDGILDLARWKDAGRKVLFVLKEPGAPSDYPSIQELVRLGWKQQARYSFLNLGRWAYGLQNAGSRSFPEYQEADLKTNRDKAFMACAIVNLRKTCSDRSDRSCDEDRLLREASRDLAATIRQINEVKPDVLLCCGRSVWEILNSAGAAVVGTRLLICHPSAFSWKTPEGGILRSVQERYNYLMHQYLQVHAPITALL